MAELIVSAYPMHEAFAIWEQLHGEFQQNMLSLDSPEKEGGYAYKRLEK